MAQSGYTPILIYASGTASNVPLAANMTSSASGAELAVNYADGKLYYKNSSGVVTLLASAAGASGDVVGPSSATNNALARFDTTTGKLIKNSVGILSDAGVLTGLTGITSSGSITFSSLTSGRVPYATTAGLLTDSANLLYSGTDLTVYGLTVGRGAGAIGTNTAVGASALAANTTGFQNTSVGYGSLGAVTTGGRNTAVGYLAGNVNTGDYNTAVGWSSLSLNTSGQLNTAIGDGALQSNTTGGENSSVGQGSLTLNTTGSFNTALGRQALRSNTTASNNTAVGYQAGFNTTTGTLNTFVGVAAGYNNRTDQGLTLVGYAAGYTANASTTSADNTFIGAYAGYNVTTGSKNTYLGGSIQNGGAGYLMTSGSKNTIVGLYNGNQGGLDIRTASNYIVLSDGDGNPRIWYGSNVAAINTTSGTISSDLTIRNPNGTSSGALSLAATSLGGGGASAIVMGNNDSGGTAGPNVIVAANRNVSIGRGDSFSSRTGGTLTTDLWVNEFGIGLQNAQPQNGIGLRFPASQSASSDANTLDDYEEGSFSPTIGSDATGLFTMTTQFGRYTKVGNLVTFIAYIAWSARPSGGSVSMSGFPFNINNWSTTGGNAATTFITKSATDAVLTNTTLGFDGTSQSNTVYAYNYARTSLIAVNSLSSSGFVAYSGIYYVV